MRLANRAEAAPILDDLAQRRPEFVDLPFSRDSLFAVDEPLGFVIGISKEPLAHLYTFVTFSARPTAVDIRTAFLILKNAANAQWGVKPFLFVLSEKCPIFDLFDHDTIMPILKDGWEQAHGAGSVVVYDKTDYREGTIILPSMTIRYGNPTGGLPIGGSIPDDNARYNPRIVAHTTSSPYSFVVDPSENIVAASFVTMPVSEEQVVAKASMVSPFKTVWGWVSNLFRWFKNWF